MNSIWKLAHDPFTSGKTKMVQPIKDPENPLYVLTAPAQRALLHYGIDTLEKIATYTEKEFRQLHGVGAQNISILKSLLQASGLSFKE